MENFSIYKDIKERTGGDIYIGVVGPVRCGKSTFITNFMQKLVMPNIKNKHQTGKNSLLDACKVIKIDDIYFTSSIILPHSSSAWMLSGMSEWWRSGNVL